NDNEESWLPYYTYARKILDQPNVFFTVTGASTRPERLLIKNPILRGGAIHPADSLFNAMFVEGWSDAEDWGRWALGRRAAIQVPLEGTRGYRLTIDALPFCFRQFAGQS